MPAGSQFAELFELKLACVSKAKVDHEVLDTRERAALSIRRFVLQFDGLAFIGGPYK